MFGGPVLPLVDDDAARALHLGDRSEVLFHAEADDGARWINRARAAVLEFLYEKQAHKEVLAA